MSDERHAMAPLSYIPAACTHGFYSASTISQSVNDFIAKCQALDDNNNNNFTKDISSANQIQSMLDNSDFG